VRAFEPPSFVRARRRLPMGDAASRRDVLCSGSLGTGLPQAVKTRAVVVSVVLLGVLAGGLGDHPVPRRVDARCAVVRRVERVSRRQPGREVMRALLRRSLNRRGCVCSAVEPCCFAGAVSAFPRHAASRRVAPRLRARGPSARRVRGAVLLLAERWAERAGVL
jgi:hypothetical protein